MFNIVLCAFVDGGTDSNNMHFMIDIKFENISHVSKLCEAKSAMFSITHTCDTDEKRTKIRNWNR